jgi:DHA2 family multidrug resistance protein
MLAADDVFRASAYIFLALIPFVWLARPVRQNRAAPASTAAPAAADAAAGAH